MERRLDCLRTGVGVLAGGTSMRSSFWLVLGVDGTDEEQSLKLPPPLLACNEGKARLREGRAAGPVPPAGRGGCRRVRELRPRDANATGRRLPALLATPAPACTASLCDTPTLSVLPLEESDYGETSLPHLTFES